MPYDVEPTGPPDPKTSTLAQVECRGRTVKDAPQAQGGYSPM